MSDNQLEQVIAGTLKFSGSICFENAAQILNQSLVVIDAVSTKDIKLDLAGLTKSDSSGLAMLTAWLRRARKNNKPLIFLNMPSFMHDLCRMSGLDSILPLERG